MTTQIPYAQKAALRESFAQLTTERLHAMWIEDERLPWAEHLLRRELCARGYAEDLLDELKSLRPKHPVYRSHADDVMAARIGATILSVGLGSAVGTLTHFNFGFMTGSVLFSTYAFYEAWVLLKSLRRLSSTAARLHAVYDHGKLVLIAAALLYSNWILFNTSR